MNDIFVSVNLQKYMFTFFLKMLNISATRVPQCCLGWGCSLPYRNIGSEAIREDGWGVVL